MAFTTGKVHTKYGVIPILEFLDDTGFARHIRQMPKEFKDLKYDVVCEKLRAKNNGKIPPELQMFRMRFWEEYDKCVVLGEGLRLKPIINEVCDVEYFRRNIKRDFIAISYIFCKPPTPEIYMRTLNNRILERFAEIIEMDIYTIDKEGNRVPNVKLLNTFINLSKTLLDRTEGGVVHRQEIHSLSANVNLPSNTPTNILKMTERLNELKGQVVPNEVLVIEGETNPKE